MGAGGGAGGPPKPPAIMGGGGGGGPPNDGGGGGGGGGGPGIYESSKLWNVSHNCWYINTQISISLFLGFSVLLSHLRWNKRFKTQTF